MSATAKADRSGRSRPTSRATIAIVPRLAATATSRNATIAPATDPTIVATNEDRRVNNGPYTAGVANHFGPTNAARASLGKSAGVRTYGFAWYVAAILP